MKTLHSILLCIGLACATNSHAAGWQSTQLTYAPYGWEIGQARGLNNLGQVVGVMEVGPMPAPPPWPHLTYPMPFVTGANGSNLQPIYSNYTPYDEFCHCGAYPDPRTINNAGQIAVVTTAYGPDVSLSLAGPGGGSISPPPPAQGWNLLISVGMNNSGQLAGTQYGPPSAFLTDTNGSNAHMPGMLDNNYESTISGINDSGQIVVNGVLTGTGEYKTFVTGPGATGIAFEPGTFGYSSSITGLNNSAQLFGTYLAVAGGEQRAFITGANGTGFTDIGSLGGPTFASALNNNGLVVGASADKAFVYGINGNGIIDLNTLLALKGGEYLNNAIDVNDRGQILAASNLGKMYLLTPVPEPTTYLMFLGGLAFIGWKTRGQAGRFT